MLYLFNVSLTSLIFKHPIFLIHANLQVSQPLAATQSDYIFCYILGTLRVYSINTQTLVIHAAMKGAGPKPGPGVKAGGKPGAGHIGLRRNIIMAGTEGNIHVMSHSKVWWWDLRKYIFVGRNLQKKKEKKRKKKGWAAFFFLSFFLSFKIYAEQSSFSQKLIQSTNTVYEILKYQKY